MAKPKYQIGAVVYDEDFRIYRKAAPEDIANPVKWAVYENGKLGDVFETSEEAKSVVADLRRFP